MIDSRAPNQGGLTGIRDAVRFVRRHKIIILAATLFFAALAWALAEKTPPQFAATAALTLNVDKVQVVEREVVSRLPLENNRLRSEIDVIRSRSLNQEVIVKLGLASNPGALWEAAIWQSQWPGVAGTIQRALARIWPGILGEDPADMRPPTTAQLTDWLIDNLKATNDGRSLTIVVTFTSRSPELAAEIANAVAQTYLDDQVLAKTRATMKASDWLGQRVDRIREDLEKSEAAVDDFRRKSGLVEVKGGTIPAERLAGLNVQLSDARLERMRAEAKLQTARESNPETLPDVLASSLIMGLRKDLAQINSDIAENQDYNTFYRQKSMNARAAVVRKQMSEEMNRIIAGLATELQVARKKEADVAQSFQQMQSQLGDAAHSGVRLIQLQREADANRSIYETFLARYKQAMAQESLAMPDARLISQASVPEDPVSPKKLRFVLVGVVGGLAIGGALAYVREGLDRRIRQASDIETVTGIPVFGFLPKVSRWRGLQPQDYPVTNPHSRFCTALARIHTALRAPQLADDKQVILVTSARPGDGKTTFCAGLARSLANNRMRVLVIDADPYRAQVASAFGASSAPSFGRIIDEHVQIGDLVQADAKSSAHFIAAPAEDDLRLLLNSGRFATLVEEARHAYDVVIIDTPPVMTSADAAVIGRFADARLLLVRWARTSWDEMTAAVGFLRLCRVGLDGIIMVGADAAAAGYGQLANYSTASSDNRVMWSPPDRRFTEVE